MHACIPLTFFFVFYFANHRICFGVFVSLEVLASHELFSFGKHRPPCTGLFSHDTDVFKKQHRTNSKIPPSDPPSTSFTLLTNSFLNHKRRKTKRVGVEINISINKRVKVKREQL